MKKFKKIDVWISFLLITAFAIATIIKRDNTFIIGYFAVGGWQIISMLMHAYCHSFTEKRGIRRNYHWITFIFLITMPVGSFLILLFLAPFMAVFYTWLCYDEERKMNQRPLELLK
jgi:hypothetical protein